MKVVVFAHTPPPHHGQSYMVELMLRGFADPRFGIECFHVNARFASDSKDIGKFRFAKPFALLAYCAQAIWLRFRRKAVTFYYVPTPPARTPLFRDWIVLLLCKPVFHHLIFHWHSAGLGEWIEKQPGWMQWFTHLALGHADVSISLGRFNELDAARFHPQRSVILPNGIPDPCPNFEQVARDRAQRLRQRLPAWNEPAEVVMPVPVRVLFLSLCSREKGLFDTIHGVAQANALCQANNLPLNFQLTIAGPFADAATEKEFHETLAQLGNPKNIRYVGFASGEAKAQLLADSDLFCFPTYYSAESLGLVLLEAMAFGLPILATRWRSLPDILPADYPGLVDIKSPDQIAAKLLPLAARDDARAFRQRFLENYTLEKHLQDLAAAFKEADRP